MSNLVPEVLSAQEYAATDRVSPRQPGHGVAMNVALEQANEGTWILASHRQTE